MEEFVPSSNKNGRSRGDFLYASPVVGTTSGDPAGCGGGGSSDSGCGCGNNKGHDDNSNSHRHGLLGIAGAFQLQPAVAAVDDKHHAVRAEGRYQYQFHEHHQAEKFCYSLVRDPAGRQGAGEGSSNDVEAIKAKIIAHPQYLDLLEAYMDCQKIGAPPEVVDRLLAARRDFESWQRSSVTLVDASAKDPELDQFMEEYYDMMVKQREEMTRPLQEATEFVRRIEAQLNSLSSNGPIPVFPSSIDDKCEGVWSPEYELPDNGGAESDQLPEIDPRAEDRELKNHLLRKYSGCLSSLKQELSKKKKKGKLPKEARQKLLGWWELHYKWPYPSETEKVALAEATGLDQKQINNWFINQRKRHWKPSEDMQFMVMDGLNPQGAALYMDSVYISNGRIA